jgi:hypothetical protein
MNRSLSGLHTDRLRAVARSGSAVGGHAIRTRVCALALLVTIALGALASVAQADGDPGSDVLVSQNLFVAADANASVNQQVQLGGLLQAAARAGLPVRVAIIANRDDLGAVTALWLKPSAYAQFLGIELSLAYKQRLLVVMPNGFGINWPGHNTASADRLLANIPTKAGGASLLNAADTAVRRLAAAAGVKLAPSTPRTGEAAGAAPPSSSSAASAAAAQSGSRPAAAQSASAPAPAQPGSAPGRTAVPSGSGDGALVFAASVAALAAIVLTVRFAARRRRRDRPMITRATEARRQASLNRRLRWGFRVWLCWSAFSLEYR